MEDYNKIIESLEIRFIKAKNINILRPITIENNYEVENFLVLVSSGEIKYGKEKELATEGDIIFIPGGRAVSMTYGDLTIENSTISGNTAGGDGGVGGSAARGASVTASGSTRCAPR